MPTPLRVLVVEDSEDDALLILRELRRGGYDVTWRRVDSAETLRAALDEGVWDIIIADYAMPGFSAPAALELIERRDLDVPFIIVSGSIGEETAVEAMKAGAQDYMMKGNLARLLPAVERELRDAADRRERWRAEELLSRLGRILEHAPIEIYVFDAETLRFTQVNRTAQENLGYTMAELASLHPHDLMPGLDEARLAAVRAGTADEMTFETTCRRKDGTVYPVEVRLELSPTETPPAIVAIVQDVTTRRLAQEEYARRMREQAARATAEAAYHQAQEADRRKDRFLAMLGHELRNPLAAIGAAVQVLDRLDGESADADRQRSIIARQTHQLTRLVDDLLDVARVSSGKITLQRTPLDLNELAERCFDSLRSLFESRDHAASLRRTPEPLVVEGDPVRLEQILCNLLDNAAKYTPPGGRIELSLECEANRGLIRVRDTGIGIAPDIRSTIFELFTQAKSARDHSAGGLGLGLALVRGLVQQHGGEVTVHSAGLGHGSEFVVRLPLARGVAVPARERETVSARPLDVLIVEDNADGREALRALLEVWGHRVAVAEDGAAGIELGRSGRPEVALVDIGLPDMEGYEVARALRAAPGERRLYLVALTGYGQAEDRERALEAGFDAHLVKPLDPDMLVRLLADVGRDGGQARSAASR
jgi:PAS domain S-box-containing protein